MPVALFERGIVSAVVVSAFAGEAVGVSCALDEVVIGFFDLEPLRAPEALDFHFPELLGVEGLGGDEGVEVPQGVGVARRAQVSQGFLNDARLAVPHLALNAPVQRRHEQALVQ